MNREETLAHIIEGYRYTIYKRYQYENIKSKYDIPDSINKETVDQLRNYFLDHIYPKYVKRVELNKAFNSLDDYIKHPKKLFVILLDATKLIFTYGRYLPKVLKAGLKAMKSFRAAAKFENAFVEQALDKKITPPYDQAKINRLINALSREEIENFIDISQSLFETLHDRELIRKIMEIIEYVIRIMKKRETSYSIDEIHGLELALDMLREGNKLFYRLKKEDQQNLVHLIIDIEKDGLKQFAE